MIFYQFSEHSIEYKNLSVIYWSWRNEMGNIFKISLLLIILAFEDANGRPSKKGIKDGKFVYIQSSVSEKWHLLNTTWIYFVCQSEVYLSQGNNTDCILHIQQKKDFTGSIRYIIRLKKLLSRYNKLKWKQNYCSLATSRIAKTRILLLCQFKGDHRFLNTAIK